MGKAVKSPTAFKKELIKALSKRTLKLTNVSIKHDIISLGAYKETPATSVHTGGITITIEAVDTSLKHKRGGVSRG